MMIKTLLVLSVIVALSSVMGCSDNNDELDAINETISITPFLFNKPKQETKKEVIINCKHDTYNNIIKCLD